MDRLDYKRMFTINGFLKIDTPFNLLSAHPELDLNSPKVPAHMASSVMRSPRTILIQKSTTPESIL